MASMVYISKSQLDYFRRLARDDQREIMAYLIGHVFGPDYTRVDYVAYTNDYRVQTPGAVDWTVPEYVRVAREAEERGGRIVGFIHSHPEWDSVLSPGDYLKCISEGHHICGVVSVYGRRTRTRMWKMDCALPCEITHVEEREETAEQAAD